MMEDKKIKKENKEAKATVETDECPICGGGNRPDFKKGYGKDVSNKMNFQVYV